MIAVMFLGLITWATVEVRQLRKLSRYYASRATYFRLLEQWDRKVQSYYESYSERNWASSKRLRVGPDKEKQQQKIREIKGDWLRYAQEREQQAAFQKNAALAACRRADYAAKMAEKYDRAARYPWLRVGADPPAPQ
jgi:hypothetical protein